MEQITERTNGMRIDRKVEKERIRQGERKEIGELKKGKRKILQSIGRRGELIG